MAMVQIGQVRVGVPHRLVHVLVDVRLGPFVAAVRVFVVLVMEVAMAMSQVSVGVLAPKSTAAASARKA
jgi:hypothetical protein